VCRWRPLRRARVQAPALWYTAQVADFLAECVRTLLGHVYTATGRLSQLVDQLTVFLQSQASSGRLGDDKGRDPVYEVEIPFPTCRQRLPRKLHAYAGGSPDDWDRLNAAKFLLTQSNLL
jgi:hypothetical protein